MPDTKMLQAILDRITTVDSNVEKGFKGVNERLDNIGRSVAYLEDDTPTIEEFNKLLRRVSKLENQLFKN